MVCGITRLDCMSKHLQLSVLRQQSKILHMNHICLSILSWFSDKGQQNPMFGPNLSQHLTLFLKGWQNRMPGAHLSQHFNLFLRQWSTESYVLIILVPVPKLLLRQRLTESYPWITPVPAPQVVSQTMVWRILCLGHTCPSTAIHFSDNGLQNPRSGSRLSQHLKLFLRQ